MKAGHVCSGRTPVVSLGMLAAAALLVLLQLPGAREGASASAARVAASASDSILAAEHTNPAGAERERPPHPPQTDITRKKFDRQASERDHRQSLTALGHRVRSLAEIDSMHGLSPRDRQALRRRHKLLHPLD